MSTETGGVCGGSLWRTIVGVAGQGHDHRWRSLADGEGCRTGACGIKIIISAERHGGGICPGIGRQARTCWIRRSASALVDPSGCAGVPARTAGVCGGSLWCTVVGVAGYDHDDRRCCLADGEGGRTGACGLKIIISGERHRGDVGTCGCWQHRTGTIRRSTGTLITPGRCAGVAGRIGSVGARPLRRFIIDITPHSHRHARRRPGNGECSRHGTRGVEIAVCCEGHCGGVITRTRRADWAGTVCCCACALIAPRRRAGVSGLAGAVGGRSLRRAIVSITVDRDCHTWSRFTHCAGDRRDGLGCRAATGDRDISRIR